MIVVMFKLIGASLIAAAIFSVADQELYGARHTHALLEVARIIARSFV